ncbi:MAG: nuclear transport factor 2 family protein [Caulobacteraceae bacterium]
MLATRVAFGVAVCVAFACAPPARAAAKDADLQTQVAQLSAEVDQLEGARAIRKLQRAYGYYVDRGLWDEASDLFADDGTIEIGMDGVYVGKARIKEYLKRLGGGQDGLIYGQLYEHAQLQPEVDVAADGVNAKGRWRELQMTGHFGKDAFWGDATEENAYVKEGGVWKLKSMHVYLNFYAPHVGGWPRLQPAAQDWTSATAKAFPPDRAPTERYRPFPDPHIAPFHYKNPVTGRVFEAPK